MIHQGDNRDTTAQKAANFFMARIAPILMVTGLVVLSYAVYDLLKPDQKETDQRLVKCQGGFPNPPNHLSDLVQNLFHQRANAKPGPPEYDPPGLIVLQNHFSKTAVNHPTHPHPAYPTKNQ